MLLFDDKNFIAKKIKLARKNADLTQAELAEKIGISAKQLSRIEMGSFVPSLLTFLKIIQELNINIDEFGILINKTNNETRDNLIKIINSANDSELKLYSEVIGVLIKNSAVV